MFYIVLLLIRAPFYVMLVFIGLCSVFWLFQLSCHYLPSDWLERPLWGSLTVATDHLHKAQAEESLWSCWFIVFFHRLIAWYLCCLAALRDIHHTPMARYSLLMLKVSLKTKQTNKLCFSRFFWPALYTYIADCYVSSSFHIKHGLEVAFVQIGAAMHE